MTEDRDAVSAVGPLGAVERSLAAMAADGRDGVWITRPSDDAARRAAAEVEARLAAGEHLPLAGFTLAVKDNIDVEGLPTTAACPAYAYRPAADAAVVDALRRAGAVVLGKANLDQFATGLVGTRSGYGLCPNAHWPALIAGGSSSGSAVAVAAGHVDVALGTDTAGSGRVPAAANGIVGLKPSRGRLSTAGVVPACRSLDCVSVFARSLDLAARVAAVAAWTGPDPADPWSRPLPLAAVPERPLRIGTARPDQLFFDGDRWAEAAFHEACELVVAAGGERRGVDLAPFVEAGRLLYGGAFVAERFAAVGRFVVDNPDEVHPVVGSIIAAAGQLPAWRLFDDLTQLRRLAAVTEPTWRDVDVLVVPTVPRLPTVAEALDEPIAVNTMLGTYTNFVNLLDLCALTVPLADVAVSADIAVGADGGGASADGGDAGGVGGDRPPVSITLVGPAGADDVLVSLAARLPLHRPAEPGTPATLRTG